jgi:hypothetical protein
MCEARTRSRFTPSVREQLHQRFQGLETPECPFANLPEASVALADDCFFIERQALTTSRPKSIPLQGIGSSFLKARTSFGQCLLTATLSRTARFASCRGRVAICPQIIWPPTQIPDAQLRPNGSHDAVLFKVQSPRGKIVAAQADI